MNNFKLIAITPLKGCSEFFSKCLTLGKPFQFYHQYDITGSGDKKIKKVKKNKSYDSVKELYKLNNGIKLDFSAVVGKNGSGKSTLFELFYYVVYFMSTRPRADTSSLLDKALHYLEYQKKCMTVDRNALIVSADLPGAAELGSAKIQKIEHLNVYIFEIIQKYKLKVNTSRSSSISGIYRIVSAELLSEISDLEHEIKRERLKEKLLDKEFNVSMLYEVNGEIRELLCEGGKVEHYKFDQKRDGVKVAFDDFSLDSFFYTISLNYSHHSLNSNSLGLWINKLFHKNDGYRTPVVINPMRDEGNFNINDELKLSRERLISTLVHDLLAGDNNLLLERYKVTKYIFTPKLGPGFVSVDPLAVEVAFNKAGIDISSIGGPYVDIALEYLNRKISKISKNYDFLIDKDDEKQQSFEKNILTDQSHVTRKIDQTLNYLKYVNTDSHTKIWGKSKGFGPISLTPEKLKGYLELFGPEIYEVNPQDIIKFALPGFFNIDFEFEDTKTKSRKIKLSDLSSGEQQSIFNINTILYHLYNIQSIHPKNTDQKKMTANPNRAVYSSVNIVLDEVELYYHPQMQRALIKNLINSFENLKESKGIKAINVCILTHSPFILSDIPACNVLLLERNKKGRSVVRGNVGESFAANINDLLADNFFLEDTLVGDFASQEIALLIERINKGTTAEDDEDFIELIGDPYLKSSLITFKKSHD
jgi:energy-coupling factor transporter ATP-binding protein EcfA2